MADYRVGVMVSPPADPARSRSGRLLCLSANFVPAGNRARPGCDEGCEGTSHRKPYTTEVVLTDGGVYDNMGTETALKPYRTVLVSDAGQKTQAEEVPPTPIGSDRACGC